MLRVLVVAGCVVLLVGAAAWSRPGGEGGSTITNRDLVTMATLEPRATLHTSLGDITLGLYEQMVPLTVDRFSDLAQAGHYNGTAVERIVKGYDVQMGDPASGGHPLPFPIPDEFHPALRHDRAGVVSMATTGPDTGTGSFFITTAAIPDYDDRYSVFGHVVEGMHVVDALADLPIQGDGAFGPPQHAVSLISVAIQPATPIPAALHHGAAVATLSAEKQASPEAGATFAVIATNGGTVQDVLALDAEAPAGWAAQFENPRVALPAGRSWAVLLTVVPDGTGPPSAEITVRVRSEAEPSVTDQVTLQVHEQADGPVPAHNATVIVEYTGVLRDGRIFDTTDAALAASPQHTRMDSYFARETFEPYSFTLGRGDVVARFETVVAETGTGAMPVVRVPWTEGYTSSSHPLFHRDLVFEVRVLDATA